MNCSPPGSSAGGILQARILEWVAIYSSGGLFHPGVEPESPALAGGFFTPDLLGKPQTNLYSMSLSCVCELWVQLSVTSGTVARQTPPSIGYPKQAYWSEWPGSAKGNQTGK